MSTTSECVYAVTNDWIIVDTDGRDVLPFHTPMNLLLGDGTVGLLTFRKLRFNKQRRNGQYVFPNDIDHNHVQFSGDFIFCEGCKCPERFYTIVSFLQEI